MSQPEQQSRPIIERLLPRLSIRFFVALIGVCALVMYTLRSAIVSDQLWAKCAALVMLTAIGCFIAYVGLFLLANLFSVVVGAVSELPVVAQRDDSERAKGEAK